MKSIQQALLAFWRQRNAREQRLLAVMGVVLGVAVLYAGIWEPARQSVIKNRAAVMRLEAERSLVAALAAEADKLKRQPAQTPLAAREVIPVIQQQAKSQGISQNGWQLSVEGESGVRLEGSMNFDDVSRLLGALAGQNQIRAQTLRVEAMPQPGQVHVKALLTHAGSEA